MENNTYIRAFGINYAGTLHKIKKSNDQLQPIFEAFTNSLEAIALLTEKTDVGQISIQLKYNSNLFSKEKKDYDFEEIVVEDTGIGFTDSEFNRLENLNDEGKGFLNKGSGRVQFLHFFDKSEFQSIFKDTSSKTGFKKRIFILSKSDAFINQNSIIYCKSLKEVKAKRPKTSITLKSPLSEKDLAFYKGLNIAELKEKIISHYLVYFCENRSAIPNISLKYSIDGRIHEETTIKSEDIPPIDKQRDLPLKYCKISADGKTIEKVERTEILNLKAFKIHKTQLNKNGLMLTSKGEIAKDIKLDSLLVDDHIDDYRYLFLVSGNYINNKDTDTRGRLNIPTLEEFRKSYYDSASLFGEEEILLDDIQETANDHILLLYDEIKRKTEEKGIEVEKLQRMFLLNPQTIREAKIKLNDTEEKILEKVYQADARLKAKTDAEIKVRIDYLNALDPNSEDFEQKFKNEIEELTRVIPLQNRTELTRYVARRKLVLELFEKILNKKLSFQEISSKNYDESLIHNLLFPKGSENPENSDLWIINEDFIYFNGVSEKMLNNVEIDNERIFKDELSAEEEKYLISLGENRKLKRPDILLFPDEGKCIIIEFKSPDVNASEHLTQIDFYASLIRNYTKEKFQISTFYGYLIGENIEPRDVLGRVTRYEPSYHFDYLFRPSENVIGFDGRSNGSIYTEVIKYSTLLRRAQLRNRIFIEKLTKPCAE